MQLTVFLTYMMTPPPTLLDLSRRNGGIYNREFPNIVGR
jgi:hypothetical protein